MIVTTSIPPRKSYRSNICYYTLSLLLATTSYHPFTVQASYESETEFASSLNTQQQRNALFQENNNNNNNNDPNPVNELIDEEELAFATANLAASLSYNLGAPSTSPNPTPTPGSPTPAPTSTPPPTPLDVCRQGSDNGFAFFGTPPSTLTSVRVPYRYEVLLSTANANVANTESTVFVPLEVQISDWLLENVDFCRQDPPGQTLFGVLGVDRQPGDTVILINGNPQGCGTLTPTATQTCFVVDGTVTVFATSNDPTQLSTIDTQTKSVIQTNIANTTDFAGIESTIVDIAYIDTAASTGGLVAARSSGDGVGEERVVEETVILSQSATKAILEEHGIKADSIQVEEEVLWKEEGNEEKEEYVEPASTASLGNDESGTNGGGGGSNKTMLALLVTGSVLAAASLGIVYLSTHYFGHTNVSTVNTEEPIFEDEEGVPQPNEDFVIDDGDADINPVGQSFSPKDNIMDYENPLVMDGKFT